ncbi:hypothetical protein GALMADRAFT_252862 [Galerina marginata CBS 339.88]|uniref:Uncharacterized protein n=1 Tax=Galerina marginata (strain CBS 339.88) TaxID=685588 RepID=A0A067SYA7_GALM3|nr:hypothetical protein GALMADRAFT_252862 [Galerina marginata CBS 339.88]
MSSHNRPIASSSMSSSARVRQLWQAFERSFASSRTVMEHKVNATKAKAESEYTKTPAHLRMSSSQHEELKAQLVKKIREPYFDDVRAQWQSRLEKAGLFAEDWTDMSQDEMDAVATVLGAEVEDQSDEDMVVVSPPQQPAPFPQPHSTPFLQPVAPSISTSTRSSNVSTASSYALVNPSEFHSEEEDDYFFHPVMATSHDLTSDDDDGPSGLPIPIHHRGNPFGGWSSDSLGSSLQNSVDSASGLPASRPLVSHFTQDTLNGRPSTGRSTASQQSEREREKSSSGNKTKLRQPYIGPHLDDTNEPLSEADDFELFKMQTRMQKIVEFHKSAALAEIHLSVEIYKDRKAPNGETQEVSARVIEHQKRMTQLQAAKEEERKATVKAERAKRRSELRTRPGRSNTLVAPIPSVPTNPSWLTNFQNDLPAQLESNFDLSKILSEDPNQQHNNVEQLLQQMFVRSETSSPSQAPPSNFSDHNPYQHQHIPAHDHPGQSSSAPRWGMSSASMQSSASGSSTHPSRAQPSRRRPSDAKRHRSRPSLFGDDDSSDEEDIPSPPSEPVNHFMHPDTDAFLSSQLQDDPELAAAFAQYSGTTTEVRYPSPPSPPMPSWSTKPTINTPAVAAQSLWASKEVRATPVASGWGKKKPFVSATPQPAAASSFSFNNPFGMADQDEYQPPFTPALSSTAKGKKPMVVPMEQQPIWEEPTKKPSPPIPAPTGWSTKPPASAPAPTPSAPPKAESKVEKAAPAPPPAPASKKQTKKGRQANKKGGAAAATVEEPEPAPPTSQPTPPQEVLVEAPVQQRSSPTQEPVPHHPEPVSLMARMIPGIGRGRRDSAASSTLPAWDDAVSTPRPAAKIPAHLQEAIKSEGTPRPNIFKKFHTSDGVGGSSTRLPVDQMNHNSTIKAPQWGAASSNAGKSSIWNMFGADSSAPKAGAAQQAASMAGTRGIHVPGGFDVNGEGDDGGGGEDNDGGGGDVEEEAQGSQQFWKAKAPVSAWSSQVEKVTSPPVQQQQPTSAAQRLRRMSEAASNSPAARIPISKTAAPATQPQAIPSPANAKKGKGKKNAKGKKVTMEEVPDDEADNRGEILPVDSKVLLLPAESLAESKVILEPKPSVPPRMYSSIISYGDEDEDEDEDATFSSFAATPSTAPSSPPDLFGGDDARIAAAIRELQEGTAKMEKVHGGGAWGTANAKHAQWTPSASEVEPESTPAFSPFGFRAAAKPSPQQTPIWGQLNSKDKGKGKMTDGEDSSRMMNPTIHNLKRSKPAAGGKLF